MEGGLTERSVGPFSFQITARIRPSREPAAALSRGAANERASTRVGAVFSFTLFLHTAFF